MKTLVPVIGLEIHIELKTKSKMFCACPADHFGKKPNAQVCPVCLGLPGALPVPNKTAIKWAVMAGLALGARVNLFSKFDRKNYFYPDLPKGFQISQYDIPFSVDGNLEGVRIRRVHLEEDTGKLQHVGSETVIDFNRSSVPLLEVVTEPDIKTSAQAKTFLKILQQKIRFLGISDCDMEKGTMRAEVNISLGTGTELPNYKVEIKNLNSFRFVEKAIEYEIKRQTELLNEGQTPKQETRGWNEAKKQTYSQRSKEEAKDYRYFPEPDIPPIRWTQEQINKLVKNLPKFPDEISIEWQEKYGITQTQAVTLSSSKRVAEYSEKALSLAKKENLETSKIANIIINKKIDWQKYSPEKLITKFKNDQNQKGPTEEQLLLMVEKVIKENPKAVEDYQKGQAGSIEFLVGQVMRASQGQASANEAREKILQLLK